MKERMPAPSAHKPAEPRGPVLTTAGGAVHSRGAGAGVVNNSGALRPMSN